MPQGRGRKRSSSQRDDGIHRAEPPNGVACHASLQQFEGWMSANGITWDAQLISLRAGPQGGHRVAWGVFATSAIEEGALLCTIPKAAILSVRTTACSDMIEAERLGGGLGLIVACMYERALGPKSKWHGYLESLPTREYLPIFWSDEELQMLEGTELECKAEADREATQEDFETDVEPLASKYKLPRSHWTLDAFRAAASWVASRAFFVDSYHGNSMVPLADVFNHKASVVELADEFVVAETADDRDGEEGEGEEEEKGEEEEEEEGEEENGEEQGEEPGRACSPSQGQASGLESHANRQHSRQGRGNQQQHGQQQAQATAGPSRRRILPSGSYERDGLNLRLEIGICSTTRDGEEVLEIVAASAVAAGHEVHNTYGEHGNAELVNKYGFALDRNPFNEVVLDQQLVLNAAEAALAQHQQRPQQQQGQPKASASRPTVVTSDKATASLARGMRQRLRMISAQSSLLDASSEPLLVLPGGCVSRTLLLLLHALLAPEEQAHAWGSLEDALQEALGGAGKGHADADGDPRGEGPSGKNDDSGEGARGCGGDGDSNSFGDAVQLSRLPAATMTPALRQALRLAVGARLARYPTSLKETAAALRAAHKAARSDELAQATKAALTLRLTEQEALQDVLAIVGPGTAPSGKSQAPASDGAPKRQRRRQ